MMKPPLPASPDRFDPDVIKAHYIALAGSLDKEGKAQPPKTDRDKCWLGIRMASALRRSGQPYKALAKLGLLKAVDEKTTSALATLKASSYRDMGQIPEAYGILGGHLPPKNAFVALVVTTLALYEDEGDGPAKVTDYLRDWGSKVGQLQQARETLMGEILWLHLVGPGIPTKAQSALVAHYPELFGWLRDGFEGLDPISFGWTI